MREHAHSKTLITVRRESAGDCAELLTALDNLGLRFVFKPEADQDLANAALGQNRWSVTDHNEAEQRPRASPYCTCTQFYVTNDRQPAPEEIPGEYDGRAVIETIIRDLKLALALGKVSSAAFDANHATFLLTRPREIDA